MLTRFKPATPSDDYQEKDTNFSSTNKEMDVNNVAEWCKKHLENWKEDATWYGRLGEAFRSSDNYKGAIEAYRKAIKLEPRSLRYLKGLALCYSADGDRDEFDKASRDMEKALSLAERTSGTNLDIAEANIHLAKWCRRLEKLEDAKRFAKKAYRLSPKVAQKYEILQILLDTDQDEEATQLLQDMLQKSGKDGLPSKPMQQILVDMAENSPYDGYGREFLHCFSLLQGDAKNFEVFLAGISYLIDHEHSDTFRGTELRIMKGAGIYYFTPASDATANEEKSHRRLARLHQRPRMVDPRLRLQASTPYARCELFPPSKATAALRKRGKPPR